MMNRRHLLCLAALLAACSKNDAASPAAAAPAAKPATAADAYALAATGHGFTVGSMMAANTVYVFFDTTCPHCAELWKSSQPLLNRLKIVWMPLGLLRPQSGPQGATILMAKDPVAAMNENETSVLARGGGISASQSIPDDVMAKVKANTEIFNQLGANSVPLIVYKNARTGQAGQHAGAVDTNGLAQLVGL